MKIGTRIATAYGLNPEPGFCNNRPMIGEFGECRNLADDGWHTFTLDSGEVIDLNNDRYEITEEI
jgi:hypothetical protein